MRLKVITHLEGQENAAIGWSEFLVQGERPHFNFTHTHTHTQKHTYTRTHKQTNTNRHT